MYLKTNGKVFFSTRNYLCLYRDRGINWMSWQFTIDLHWITSTAHPLRLWILCPNNDFIVMSILAYKAASLWGVILSLEIWALVNCTLYNLSYRCANPSQSSVSVRPAVVSASSLPSFGYSNMILPWAPTQVWFYFEIIGWNGELIMSDGLTDRRMDQTTNKELQLIVFNNHRIRYLLHIFYEGFLYKIQ